jgi:site-specific recombinase XerD
MAVRVAGSPRGYRLVGDGSVVEAGNAFLEHLVVRGFSPATVRAYAFDLANFAGFLADRSLGLGDVVPSDLFDYLDWATRVRPHRLRHTYGTELAAAGIDLLVLRELMGHASPETTACYVHLSSDTLAAEFAAARAATGQ